MERSQGRDYREMPRRREDWDEEGYQSEGRWRDEYGSPHDQGEHWENRGEHQRGYERGEERGYGRGGWEERGRQGEYYGSSSPYGRGEREYGGRQSYEEPFTGAEARREHRGDYRDYRGESRGESGRGPSREEWRRQGPGEYRGGPRQGSWNERTRSMRRGQGYWNSEDQSPWRQGFRGGEPGYGEYPEPGWQTRSSWRERQGQSQSDWGNEARGGWGPEPNYGYAEREYGRQERGRSRGGDERSDYEEWLREHRGGPRETEGERQLEGLQPQHRSHPIDRRHDDESERRDQPRSQRRFEGSGSEDYEYEAAQRRPGRNRPQRQGSTQSKESGRSGPRKARSTD